MPELETLGWLPFEIRDLHRLVQMHLFIGMKFASPPPGVFPANRHQCLAIH